jgi:glycogen operon protein
MAREGDDWTLTLPGDHAGVRYGYRAQANGRPSAAVVRSGQAAGRSLAVALDRRFAYDLALSTFGVDTAPLVPKASCPALAAGAAGPARLRAGRPDL